MTPARTETSAAEEIFELLKRRGALCASQLSVELLISLKAVRDALEELKSLGLVAQRPDRDSALNRVAEEIPWGLRRPFSRAQPAS